MATIELDGLRAYRADPDGDPRGGIILIHEIWGLVPHITGIADRFAGEGYVVLAPDLLSDVGVTPEVGEELSAAMADPDESRRTAAQPRMRSANAVRRTAVNPSPATKFLIGRAHARPFCYLAARQVRGGGI